MLKITMTDEMKHSYATNVNGSRRYRTKGQTTSVTHAKLLCYSTYFPTNRKVEGNRVAETFMSSVRRVFCEFFTQSAALIFHFRPF